MRQLHEIAYEIKYLWTRPNFAAVPYLDAMVSLNTVKDAYGCDSGRSIVSYFLCNAGTWKGADARRIKKELNAHIGR